jgi:hypothetical protein
LSSSLVEETVDYASYGIMAGGILGILLLIVITLRFISGRGDYYDDEDEDGWFDDDDDEFSPIQTSSVAAPAHSVSNKSVGQTPPRNTPPRESPPVQKRGPPARKSAPPARKSGPPERATKTSKTPKAVRRTSAPVNVDSVPRVSTKKVDPRKATPTKRVRRTSGVVTSKEPTEKIPRQVKATKKVKRTNQSPSESGEWDNLFEENQRDSYSSSLEAVKSMLSSGSEDREILRRLQRGDGWSAEQSRYILDAAR